MFNSIISNSTDGIAMTTILVCSLVSIVLGVIIAITHKFTSKSNKNYLITISTLPLMVQAVILMVNGNLGTSVAIAGAFALVRFRSIPGTSKEILTVFFAMTIGLATGMGHILFACLTTVLGCITLALLSFINLFEPNSHEKILKITIPEDLNYTDVFAKEFNKYTNKAKLEQVKTTNMGSLFELTYRITINKDCNEKNFIDDLRIKNANLKIILTEPTDNNNL